MLGRPGIARDVVQPFALYDGVFLQDLKSRGRAETADHIADRVPPGARSSVLVARP